MTGTVLNVCGVLLGGSVGVIAGRHMNSRFKDTLKSGLGLITIAMGCSLYAKSSEQVIPIVSLLLGGILGEAFQLDEALQAFAAVLSDYGTRKSGSKSIFVKGFVTGSVVFCVGPMTILGCLQEGISGSFSLLSIKAVLDGCAAFALSASLGGGVVCSALTILLYQAILTILASQAQVLLDEVANQDMTATGGLIMLAIAIGSLLEVCKTRSTSLLPALLIAPLLSSVT